MSSQQPPTKKSTTGLWLGGAAILLVALIAVLVLLLNRQPAPAAPASAVIVSAATVTPEPVVATPTAVDTSTPVPADTPTSTPMPELGTSNLFIEYILDASGSMSETLSDGSPKIEVAQRVLTEHMRSFRPETNIGLRVYGHRLPYQQTDESCQDIELIAPPEKGQMERIVGWLQDFTVQGMTPLAASLELATDDFVYDASRINSIVMLSDGIETCGGDPCRLVEGLKAEGINFTIHVIGLDVDDPTRQQLTCIAEAGDGTYHDARSQQELNAALGAVKEDVTKDEVIVPSGVNTPTPQVIAQFDAAQATAVAAVQATQQAQATATTLASIQQATAVAAVQATQQAQATATALSSIQQATAEAAAQATQQAQATATALASIQQATAVAAVQATQQAQAAATALASVQQATAEAAVQATQQAQATATAEAWSQIVVCGQWRTACNGAKAFQPCGTNRVAYWDQLDNSPWFQEGQFVRVYNNRPFFNDAEPDGNIAGIVLSCDEWPVPGGWMSWSGSEQVEPINSCGECYNIP